MSSGLAALSAIFLLLVAAPRAADAQPASVPLDSGWQLREKSYVPETGDAISRTNYSSSAWYAATVPGTVLTTLVNNGVYPEPLYGTNNYASIIPDSLCRTSYWYRTAFTVPAAYTGKRVWLNFQGINYTADVWVNGNYLGLIRGAFARGSFDVTSYVNVGENGS